MSLHCTYHCRACGSHFTSLQAFDSHRVGPHDGERVCKDPDECKGVELYGDGVCKIAGNLSRPKVGVLVYGIRGGREKMRKAFPEHGAERETDSEAA